MISTSSYEQWQSNIYKTYSISLDCGKDANYRGECYTALAPKPYFFRKWRNNIGKVSEAENNRYYVQEYWEQVLSNLDPEDVYRELDYSVMLCYEDNTGFCHRHIVAAWFEILLGVNIPEVRSKGYFIEEVPKPQYIKQYLEDAMRLNRNMRGFKSLRALYLFEKGEKMQQKALELEKTTGKSYDYYKQMACNLRCEADMEDDKYKKLETPKKLIKIPNK